MTRRWLPAAVLLAAIVITRLPALWTPILDVDEAQFAGFADAILSGGVPYVDSVDTKPPGIYYFYAAIFALFGRGNMIAVHAATALVVFLTALACFRIGRAVSSEQAGPPVLPAGGLAWRAGFFAALLYAAFTTAQFPKFIATSIAIVMVLPLTASVDALLAWERGRGRRAIVAAGLLWGIACLFKYQAGINLLVAAPFLLFARPSGRARGWGERLCDLAAFVAGGAIAGALCAFLLFRIGAWEAFVFWSLKGSVAYVEAASSLPGSFDQFLVQSWRMIAWGLPMWGLAVAGIFLTIRAMARKGEGRGSGMGPPLMVLWLLFSVIPVCVGGKFYEHYYLQLFPPLCVLGGAGAAAFLSWREALARPLLRRGLAALFAFGFVAPAAAAFAMRLDPKRVNALIDEETPTDYLPIGRSVREHTGEGDHIFVWGFATPVYFYSGRQAASRFLWSDWQTGRVSGKVAARSASFDPTPYVWPGSWEMLFEDLEKNRPALFVDTSPGNYHNYGRYPVQNYPPLADYLRYHYHFEANVNNAIIYRRNSSF